jgi:hypothetical protein
MWERVLTLTVSLWLFTNVAVADVVSADNIGGAPQNSGYFTGIGYAGLYGFTNEAAAQEFTAQVGGQITTLLATVGQAEAEGVPLHVAIHGKSGGSVGPILGQVTFASSEVPSGLDAHAFDLSPAAIDLSAGGSYFAVFTVDTPITGSVRYSAYRAANPAMLFGIRPLTSRDGGISWEESTIDPEIGLTVYVVPEPSALLLLSAGSGLVSRRLRRRRRVLR